MSAVISYSLFLHSFFLLFLPSFLPSSFFLLFLSSILPSFLTHSLPFLAYYLASFSSFICSLLHYSSFHSFVRLSSRSFVHLFFLSFIHPSIHPFIHPSIHSFIHSAIHSFIHPSMCARLGQLVSSLTANQKVPCSIPGQVEG